MSFWIQLKYLLWKNFLLRKRQKLWAAVELIWPLILFLILVWVRTRDLTEKYHECHYTAKSMPSSGLLPFLQSYLCTIANKCHQEPNTDADVGVVNSEYSFLNILYEQTQNFLAEGDAASETETLLYLLEYFVNFTSAVKQSQPVSGNVKVSSLFKNVTQFESLAVVYDMSPQTAHDWGESYMKPEFFVAVIKIMVDDNVTLNDIRNPLESEPLEQALLDVQRKIYCNFTVVNSTMIAYNGSVLREVGNGVCNLNLQAFLFDAVVSEMINRTAMTSAMNDVLQNVTGLQLTMNSVEKLFAMFNKTRKDLNSTSDISRFFIDVLNGFRTSTKLTNGTRNPVFRSFCGNSTDDDFNSMFKGKSNLDQLRERFRGEKEPQPDVNKANETFNYQKDETPKPMDDEPTVGNQTLLCNASRLEPIEEAECWYFLQKFNFPKSFLIPLYTMLRGFIIVSPISQATSDVITKLEEWLDAIVIIQAYAKDFNLNADNYQNLLYNSTLAESYRVVYQLIMGIENVSSVVPENVIEGLRFLNTFFLPADDTLSALPLLRTRFSMLINFTTCFRTKTRIIYVPDERDLESLAMCLSDYYLYLGGVAFQFDSNTNQLPTLTTYKIRMANYLTDGTTRVMDKIWNPKPRDRPFIDMKYLYYGFSFLQDAVDRAIIELQTNTSTRTGVYAQQFPNPCYQIDAFVRAIARMLPLCMSLAWVFSASLIVKNVVYEKELRLKEFMKVMGLSNFVHWVAWFIQTFIMLFSSIVLFVIIIKYGRIVQKSDPSLLFVFLILYAIATIAQCFLISTLFNRANLAAACGAFMYFLFYLPYPVMINFADGMSHGQKAASCLLAQVAFGWGCSYVAMWEDEGSGLQWSNFRISADSYDNFNFSTTMLMLIVDSAIYIILTWYIEAVFPGEYGIPHPFYFPFQRSYWCGERCQKSNVALIELDGIVNENLKNYIETEPRHLSMGVSVCNLRKVYSNGKVAVDGLSLNFYENQITSFLGHNGAGKTTTISILTGLFPPSTGTVMACGKDIRTQIDSIRKSLGMCPQHNILFDILTVEETLRFYGGLKGVPREKMREEVRKMLKQLGLKDKKHAQAKDLSGGMQRKLSIAVAFIGDPKIVVLDEPTAGVDPFARRSIWDLLLQHKAGRTIILSTHHMDEADLLGDRIAIISSGRLKCCGSSLFLKKLYGSGYYLTIVCESKSRMSSAKSSPTSTKKQNLTPMDSMPKNNTNLKVPILPPITKNRSSSNLDVDILSETICAFVANEVSGAKMVEKVGQEIVFCLPSEDPQMLCKFFVRLDENLKRLGISSYGVSETTLEEIFLKADAQDEQDEKKVDCDDSTCCDKMYVHLKKKFGSKKRPNEAVDLVESSSDEDEVTNEIVLMPGVVKPEDQSRWWLLKRQTRALLVKRFKNFLRNKKGAFCEIVLPVIVIALTMFGLSLQPSTVLDQPPLLLTPWLYAPPNEIFYSLDQSDNLSETVGHRYLEAMVDQPGLGCRCMPQQPLLSDGLACKPVLGQSIFGARTYEDVTIQQDLCNCDEESVYRCPASAYAPDPPNILTNTTDYLFNMTMLNITQWILMTDKLYRKHRYGGFSLGEVNKVAAANVNWTEIDSNVIIIGRSLEKFYDAVGLNWSSVRDYPWADIDDPKDNTTVPIVRNATNALQSLLSGLEVKNNVKVWYNNQGWAALPAYVNTLSNAMLRALLPSNKNPSDYGIVAYNDPMNYSKSQQGQRLAFGYNLGIELTEAVMIVLAFSIIPASFILFLIEEKTCQAKHLQFVSGVEPNLYWIVNFGWDLINFLIPTLGVMIIFFIFDEPAYVGWFRNGLATFLLLYIYGFATIPIMYCFTFVFRIPSLAFISLAVGNLFLGWITTTVTATLEMLGEDDEGLKRINDVCMVVFLIFPQYCLGRGVLDLKIAYFYYMGENFAFGNADPPDPFLWKFLGRNFFCLLVEGVFGFALVLFIEYRKMRRRKSTIAEVEPPPQDEDKDVRAEREHVEKENSDHSALKITNLTKDYTSNICTCSNRKIIRAVDNLCVAVERGECFGLLGVNGAGKTTTFNLLTGKSAVTSGDAFFGGYSILKNLDRVRQQIGFCPQFDALNLLLTAREQLTFYARLRGVPEKDVKKVVSSIISHLGLDIYADRTSSTYSGGNKRKLSTAIALIGNPPVVLLDEPTTGMDPKARRFLWNRINEIVRDGRSVILTSHSMEECEALCNRIGIMVNGRFQCLGSVQHLKSRFGQGYTLTLKLSGEQPKTEEAARVLKARFPEAVLKERHLSQLQYQLPAKGVMLSDVFQFVVKVQQSLDVEDYSLCQTTLDEVFIAFAKMQREMTPSCKNETRSGCCWCCFERFDHSESMPLNDCTVLSTPQTTVPNTPSSKSCSTPKVSTAATAATSSTSTSPKTTTANKDLKTSSTRSSPESKRISPVAKRSSPETDRSSREV